MNSQPHSGRKDEKMTEMTHELSWEELEKISGGSWRTVSISNVNVRSGPGMACSSVGVLHGGTVVNYTGEDFCNDEENTRWVLINSPISGWVRAVELGMNG